MKRTVFLIILSVIIFFIFVFLLDLEINFARSDANGSSYEMYCPSQCPNSLWTSTDGDIYFAVDKNGLALGASRINGEVSYFGMVFNEQPYRGSPALRYRVAELGNIAYPDVDDWTFISGGRARYEKDSCILTYYGPYDIDDYFGDRKGMVKLTFVRTNLTAPFSFDDDASLSELPFR